MLPNGLGINARRSTRDDEAAIEDLVKQHKPQYISQYGPFLVGYLIETSILSVSIVDDNETVVGYAAFSDSPPAGLQVGPLRQHCWPEWYTATFDTTDSPIPSAIWCVAFVCAEEHLAAVYDMVLHTCFATLHWTANILLLLPLETPSHALIAHPDSHFAPLPLRDASYFGPRVHRCSRDGFIPRLLVRRARLEDHDDLAPLFEEHSHALAELYGDFFLADLIEAQDEQTACLVGEVAGAAGAAGEAAGRAVGLLSVTADVDVTLLNECFDLTLYDGLLQQPEGTRPPPQARAEHAPASADAAQPLSHLRRLSVVYDALLGTFCGFTPAPAPAASLSDPDALLAPAWPQPPAPGPVRAALLRVLSGLLEQFVRAVAERALPVPQVEVTPEGEPRLLPASAPLLLASHTAADAVATLAHTAPASLDRDGFLRCVSTFAAALGPVAVAGAAPRPALEAILPFLEQACRPPRRRAPDPQRQQRLQEEQQDRLARARALAALTGDSSDALLDLDNAEDTDPAPVAAPELPVADPVPNAFAVVLYCLADALEPRGIDLLPAAFALFPHLDYCVLTLPHACAEHELLAHFTPVAPRPASTLPHALYVIHRDALTADVALEWAAPQHADEIRQLLELCQPESAPEALLQPPAGTAAHGDADGELDGVLDGIEAVHGRLTPGTGAAQLFRLFEASVVDDQQQRDAFEQEREDRKQQRANFRALPQPATGPPPAAAAAEAAALAAEEEAEAQLDYESVRGLRRRLSAFVVRAAGQVVGLFALRTRPAPAVLAAEHAFALHEYVSLSDLRSHAEATASPRAWCAQSQPFADVVAFALNPLFRAHVPRLCREAMRLAAKHVLLVPAHITAALHGLPVHLRARAAPALPPGVPALAPVVTSDARDLDTCMSLLSRKLLSLPRAPINARVVVVGASDTGLSTLELLLAHPDVYFTSLTLVSPDGLPYLADEVTPCLPWSLAHDPARVRRSGLASRVRVVEEAVVAVDTERDVVRLGSGALLAFDCLVIATGLVDGTAAAVGADAWKLERERDTARMARALGLDLLTVGTAPANNEADKDDEPAPDANADTNADADAEAGPDADSALVAPRGPVAGLVTVRTERDADQLLRLVRARPPACAVVYGCTLRAVVLLGALLDAGVPGDALVWAHPQPADAAAWAAGDEVVADTVRAALRGRGVTILPLTRLDAVRCTREGALARLICTNLDADAQFAVDCGLCLCAADVDADPHMLAALAAVSAAYDGRLLVDRGLRVCGIDKGNVLAAGSLCKFARKLNACAPLADYSPPALGACLARAVVECVDALQAESAPRLDAVRVLGAPGGAEAGRVCGLQYLRVRQEPAEGAPDPEQCQVLTSRMDGRYCKLVFGGRNHALVELVLLAETGPGHQELPLTTLARLVGLPAVFLPAVFACEGDLVAALWSPKTLALAHDALPALRQAAAAALANPGPSGDESAVARLVEAMGEVSGPERVEVARKLAQELDEDKKRAVRASVWEFVVANADHLPGYAVPAVKQ